MTPPRCVTLVLLVSLFGWMPVACGAVEERVEDWCAAIDFYQDGRYSEARTALRRLEVSSPDVEIDFHLGRLALWLDDQGEALARLERALAASRGYARLHNALGAACGLAAQQAIHR